MRKKIITACLAVIMVAALLWGAACLWLITLGPRWIENRIKRAYPHNVTVQKATTNGFNAIRLHQISFEGSVPGGIRQAEIALRWRGPILKLNEMNVTVDVTAHQSTFPSIPVLPFPIRIENSIVHLKSGKGAFQITNITGELKNHLLGIESRVTGSIDDFGPISATVELSRSTPLVWKADIHSPSLNVGALRSLPGIPEEARNISGQIDAHLVANGTADGNIFEKAIWSIEAESKTLRWQSNESSTAVGVTGAVKLTPDNLEITSLKIDRSIFVTGSILSPLSRPIYQIDIRSTDWSLSHLKNIFPSANALSVDGNASIDIKLSGEKSNPNIHGNFSIRPILGSMKLPLASGQISVKDNNTSVLADFAEGTLTLQKAELNETSDKYAIVLKNVSLSEIARENGWENVHGRFNTHLNVRTANGSPLLKGAFSISDLQWGRARKQSETSGQLLLSPSMISFSTDDDTLTLVTEMDDKVVRLSNFHADFGSGSKISARGIYTRSENKLNFAVDGQNIPPDIWPPLVARYPDISGDMSFSGTVRGTSNRPSFQFQTSFKEIRFIDAGGNWNGSASAEWDGGALELRDIGVDGGYSGSLKIKKMNATTALFADIALTDANPQLMFDLMKSTLTSGGRLTGLVHLRNDGNGLVGVSSTVWTTGRIDRFDFDEVSSQVRFAQSSITIDDLRVIHHAGSVRGSGSVALQNEFAKYNLALQLQQVGGQKVKFDGELSANGIISTKDGSGRGQLTSPLLLINDYALERTNLRFDNYGSIINIVGNGGNSLALQLKANRRLRTISGRVAASDVQIYETLEKILSINDPESLPTGTCTISASIDGTWDAPAFHAKLNIPSGKWKEEPFSSSLVFDVSASSLTIKGAEVALKNGGTVFVSGVLPFNDEQSASLTGAGSALNLQSVMHLLGWPLTWAGKTNATFSMIGAGEGKKMIITFDGDHDGFGPIKKGGKLSGTAAWQNGEWDLSNIRVDSGDGFVRLRNGSVLFIDKNNSGKMRLVADTRNIHMGLLTFFGRLELTGSWDGSKITPDGKAGPVELEVFARSLWINQYVLDGNVSHLTIDHKRLKFSPIIGTDQQLSGTLDYADYPSLTVNNLKLLDDGVEQFYLDGLVGPQKWDFKLHTKKIDASVVRGFFDTSLPMSGPMEVKLIGQGSIDNPIISASIDWRNGKIGPLPMDQATCSVRLKNGIVELNDIQLEKKKGYLLTGDMRLGTALLDDGTTVLPRINLKLTRGNMEILESIFPEFNHAHGTFEGHLNIDAVKNQPRLRGFLTASNLSFRSSSYVPDLRKGEIELHIENDVLHIERARAQMGRGILNSSGTITFENGLPDTYALRLYTTERGVSIRVPDLAIPPGAFIGRFSALKSKLSGVSRGEPRLDLSLTGPAINPKLSGTVWLDNTIFTYPPTEASKRSTSEINWIQSWLSDLYRSLDWDMTIIAGKRTQYENNLVSAGVSGQLRLLGPSQNIDVHGTITTEQGVIVYAGNEFKIQDATLEITPDVRFGDEKGSTLVYLKASAEREIFYTDVSGNSLTDVIYMEVDRALIGEIQPRFRSKNNPGLPSNRALQLALGIPLTESLEDNLPVSLNRSPEEKADVNRMLRLGLVQLIDSNLTSPLARALARQTGLVDSIRVSYEEKDTHPVNQTPANENTLTGTNPGNQNAWWRQLKGTKVKFGRELTSRLFADYSFKVDEYQNELDFRHEVELAYRVHRNLFIRATSELDSEQTLGRSPDRRALIENRWRFGLPRPKTKTQTNP